MERRVIDMEKDPRREQFQLFSGYSFPYAGVTVQLDVTALELRLRAEHKPIFLTMLYVIHRAVNRVPELRRRIEDGQVVEYDECPVSFTEMKPDGSYAYYRLETARVPYEDYIAMGRVQQAAARQGGTIETDRRAESPSIFASCLPWLNYTSLTHPACTPADSNVRISWGQLFMRCGMTQLSVSIQVHHALADGWHIAQFYRALEEEIAALCPTEENQ